MEGLFDDPAPPVNNIMPGNWQKGVAAVTALIAIATIATAIYNSYKERSPFHLWAAAGSALAVMLEPFCLIMCLAWHSAAGQWTAFTIFGRSVPVYALMIYVSYYYLPFLLIDALLRRGALSQQVFWAIFLSLPMTGLVWEIFLIGHGMHAYYGNQPLQIFGMPLWWMFVCGTIMAVSAAALCFLKYHARTAVQRFLAILIPPAAEGGVVIVVGWPIVDALYGHASRPVIWAASFVSIGFALIVGHLCWLVFSNLDDQIGESSLRRLKNLKAAGA